MPWPLPPCVAFDETEPYGSFSVGVKNGVSNLFYTSTRIITESSIITFNLSAPLVDTFRPLERGYSDLSAIRIDEEIAAFCR
jgi:hypothetical protein